MENENTKKCKYCGLTIRRGKICATCSEKRPLVQELIKEGEPFRKLKAQRDRRRKAEKE